MAHPSRTARLSPHDLRRLLVERPVDRHQWDTLLGETVHLRIGNSAPVTNKIAAIETMIVFLSRIEAIGSEFYDMWQKREAVFVETDIVFRNRCGQSVTIPCTLIARSAFGKFLDVRLYLDPSPIP